MVVRVRLSRCCATTSLGDRKGRCREAGAEAVSTADALVAASRNQAIRAIVVAGGCRRALNGGMGGRPLALENRAMDHAGLLEPGAVVCAGTAAHSVDGTGGESTRAGCRGVGRGPFDWLRRLAYASGTTVGRDDRGYARHGSFIVCRIATGRSRGIASGRQRVAPVTPSLASRSR